MMTPDEILELALEKETQARDFYGKLAATCSIDFVSELLEKLESEEMKHIHLIENMLGRLRAGKEIT